MPTRSPAENRYRMDSWRDTVIINRQVFAANSIEEIAEVFPDHAVD